MYNVCVFVVCVCGGPDKGRLSQGSQDLLRRSVEFRWREVERDEPPLILRRRAGLRRGGRQSPVRRQLDDLS